MPFEPTRDTDGYSGTNADHVLHMVPWGKPLAWQIYFDDFHVYLPGGAGAGDWTKTETGAGTQVIADEAGGVLLLTCAAADNDRIQLQLVAESFLPATAKQCAFAARVKISDATQSVCAIGLATEQATTNFFHDTGDLWLYDDGIMFRKDDGNTQWDFAIRKDDTETLAENILTATTGYVELGFYYNGAGKVVYYTALTTPKGDFYTSGGLDNWPNDAELTPTLFIENGEAVAKALSVDYLWVGIER